MNTKIVVDAMGGDNNVPDINIEGSLKALKEISLIDIILVGPEKELKERLSKYKNFFGKVFNRIEIINSDSIVTMDDQPSKVLRTKRDSSMAVGIKLVKENKADAFISAGNSGAIAGFALTQIGTMQGIDRPALATTFPTLKDPCVLIDAGANVDCKPKQLLEFAYMGSAYYRCVIGKENPRVGLLSIGNEEGKGNSQTIETYELLKQSKLNFIGNIEGKDIPSGEVDVIVFDGFIGNIVLKLSEGIAEMLMKLIKQSIKRHPITFFALPFVWNATKDLRKKIDFDEYGGAPLLGLEKVCLISHGRSNAKAIKNAIKTATQIVEKNFNSMISEYLSQGI